MNEKELREIWKKEEAVAHIYGWDFSHIAGRYEEEENLPWAYENIIRKYLKDDMRILDYDTGGGEFLLSLKHPFSNTAATEGYPPNVELCKEKLLPLGIDFKACNDRELVEMVLPNTEKPFPDLYLEKQEKAFEEAGFDVIEKGETYRPIVFYDIGAFVWFARIIEWEFLDFAVDKCFEQLLKMQQMVEENGKVEGTIHRYLIVAKK